jgi:tRNA A37 threonylcarbamoyladenosine synthetase subunit TsaC/SUA5/YrdC
MTMMEQPLTVSRDERDAAGNLLPEHLAEIRRVLQDGGFVMLPSDTAYSVAVWPASVRIRRQVNKLLVREDHEPISLAFPSREAVRRWTEPNDLAEALLGRGAA